MSTIDTMNLGVQGINKGMNGLRQNAQQIAHANVRDEAASGDRNWAGVDDVAEPLVDMKLNKLEVEMSAKVVQTASDMIGTLLDIKA